MTQQVEGVFVPYPTLPWVGYTLHVNLSSPPAPASPAMRHSASGLLFMAAGILVYPICKIDMQPGKVVAT